MLNRIRTEPALVSGLVIVLVNAAVAFGLSLTDEQTFAINAVVAAALALVTRSRVIPVYPERDERGELGLQFVVGVVVGVLLMLLLGQRL